MKSDSSDRFSMDFRKVNGVTKPDCYPLPRIDDFVDHVGSATYVTKLDLLKGYWQVPLTQGDKTAKLRLSLQTPFCNIRLCRLA